MPLKSATLELATESATLLEKQNIPGYTALSFSDLKHYRNNCFSLPVLSSPPRKICSKNTKPGASNHCSSHRKQICQLVFCFFLPRSTPVGFNSFPIHIIRAPDKFIAKTNCHRVLLPRP